LSHSAAGEIDEKIDFGGSAVALRSTGAMAQITVTTGASRATI
jgi:hypothetical protein